MQKYDIVSIVSELVSGENMVRKRRNGDALRRIRWRFPAFWFPMWRFVVWLLGFRVWFLYDCGAIAAFGNL